VGGVVTGKLFLVTYLLTLKVKYNHGTTELSSAADKAKPGMINDSNAE